MDVFILHNQLLVILKVWKNQIPKRVIHIKRNQSFKTTIHFSKKKKKGIIHRYILNEGRLNLMLTTYVCFIKINNLNDIN